MKNPPGTKQELIKEISALTRRIQELEQPESERKQMEEAQKLHVAVTETVAEGIFLIGLEDNIIKWTNRKFEKLFGYGPGEMVGLHVDKVNAPTEQTPKETRISIVDVLRQTGEWHGEIQNIKKDGTHFWSFIHVSLFNHPEFGSVMVSAHTDITERKRAEEEVQFRSEIMTNIAEAIYLVRMGDGVIVYTNSMFERMFGYEQDEMLGKHVSIVNAPSEKKPEETAKEIMAEINDKGSWKGEVNNIKKDGTTFWCYANVSVFDHSKYGRVLVAIHADISERKQAEKDILEQRTLSQKYLQIASVMIVALNAAGEITLINKKGLDILGYKDEQELLGKNWFEVSLPENVVAEVKLVFSQLMSCNIQPVEYYENPVLTKNGEERIIAFHNSLLRDKEGKISGILSSGEDITERKRAVEALRVSEEWYRTILQTTMDGFWRVDIQGHLLEVNETYCRMSGYSKEELLTMSISDLEATEPDAETAAHIQKVMTRSEDRFETWHHRKDGSVLEVEVSVQYKPSKEGQLVAFLRDITNRKQAEEALRRSETNYRSVIENIQDVFYRSDAQGDLIMASPSYATLLGYESLDDCLGKSIAGTIYYDPEKRKELLRELQGKGSVTNYEVVLKRRDGTPVTVETNSHFYLDDSGNIAGVEGTFRDMTERKQAEDEKRRLEERLQHADKMESIGTLAGGIAHDFNNLLMGIQGYASLSLMNLDPSHPNYERLRRIEDQVQSGADLTRQLLGFARGGRYDVKPADMNDILEKSSSMFGRTKKEISIHLKYGEDLWTVEVDQGQMEQVFMNLYVNAWQAMPGGGDIYLDTENIILDDERAAPYAVKPGRYIKISTTDTGTGMDEKTRERIFDPFFTTKEMGRGTGLGLATVYGIIKGHGGMINVYSEPGHGTTFTIYLPASEKEVVKEKTETATIARGTETILLVDDEKMVLEVSKELLESLGYRVCAAGSGQDALAVYLEKQKEIDLVILDMIMPGISGGETFDRLREINPGIRVLLSSGYSINGKAQTIMDRGCNGFLQKPFHLENLSRKVREILG